EVLILQLGISALDDNVFALDPLESESEEWDFGRRKQLVTGFVSHHFGARTTVTASVRYHHERGPNLLLPLETAGSGPLTADRLATRADWRLDVRRHAALVVQGSYEQNWSNQPELSFQRFLFAAGVQLKFR